MTLNFATYLMLLGDVAFVAGLILMALLSAGAGAQMLPGEKLPMQWGLTGKVRWAARKRFGLLFAPGVAALCGVLLTAMAHLGPRDLTQEAVNLAVIRVTTALGLVLGHMLHLWFALGWLRQNRK